MADKQVSVRFKAEGGVQLRQEFLGIGQAAERAGAEMERGVTRGGSAWQNVGFQVQDFAVQVAGGTDATRALAQQLPQLLGGFGGLGIAIGTAAAVILPLIGYFSSVGEEAEAAADRVDRLVDSVAELKKANESFSLEGIKAIVEEYGKLDAAVALLISRQQQYSEGQAIANAKQVTSGFQVEFEGIFAYLDEYESRLQQIQQATGATEAEAQAFGALKESIFFLNEEFGVSIEQARAIKDALADLNAASDLPEAAASLARLTGLLKDSALAGTDLEGELLAAESAVRQLNAEGEGVGGWLGTAIDWAGTLGGKLWEAAAAAAAIRGAQGVDPNLIGGGRGLGPGGPALDPFGFRDQLARDEAARRAAEEIVSRASRGGGGGSGASSNLADLREAERLYESTRTEAERYATEVENLNRLLREGDIDASLHARAIEEVRAKYAEAANEGLTFKDAIRDISQSLVDAARSGKNLGETLGQVFTDIAADLAASQLQRLLLSAFSPILGRFGLQTSTPILQSFSASSGLRAVQSVGGASAQAAGSRKISVNLVGGGLAREDVDVSETTGPGGETQIDIVLKKKMQGMLASGQLDGAMRAAYGLRRVAG